MINPELIDYSAVCHPSPWRPLRIETGEPNSRPQHYIALTPDERILLAQTGTLSVPERGLPAPVREHQERMRKIEEALADA